MAQVLQEFEEKIERPLLTGGSVRVEDMETMKRTFRKKLQALASDCLDLMPSDMEINAFEPLRSRS